LPTAHARCTVTRPIELAHLPAASNDILAAARESFRNLNLKYPRNLALPMQMALQW